MRKKYTGFDDLFHLDMGYSLDTTVSNRIESV